MFRILRLLPLLLVLLLVGAGVSCKGGGDKKPAATATERQAPPTPAEATGQPTQKPSARAPPFDSFHYAVDLSFNIMQPGQAETALVSGTIEGDYVGPDSHAFSSSFEVAG